MISLTHLIQYSRKHGIQCFSSLWVFLGWFYFSCEAILLPLLHLPSCFGMMPGSHRSLCLSSFLQSVSLKSSSKVSPEYSWSLLEESTLSFPRLNRRVKTTYFVHIVQTILGNSGTTSQWFSWLWVRRYGMQRAILMTLIMANWIIFLQLIACFLYQTYSSISLALKVQSTGINPACDTF